MTKPKHFEKKTAESGHLLVKICGLKTEEAVVAAIEAGADMIGFVFHPKSPRYLEWREGPALARLVPAGICKVALMVNPTPYELKENWASVGAELFQLHGSADTTADRYPDTVEGIAEIKQWLEMPVMKAIGVASAEDVAAVPAYAAVADRILLDAKPPKDAAYPGGHGRPFDWAILAGLPRDLPFMLSGGLTPENVGEAIRAVRGMGLNLIGVDVSSGVESAPGVKDVAKIRAFVAAVREAERQVAGGEV